VTFLPNSTFPSRASENVDFRFVEANKYPTNNLFYFVVYNNFQQQMYPVLGSYELIHAPKVIYLYNNRLESLTLATFHLEDPGWSPRRDVEWIYIGRKEEEEEAAWDHLHLFIIKVWIWKITVKFNGAYNIEFGACNFDKAK